MTPIEAPAGQQAEEQSVKDLMRAYVRSLDALKARGVIRSTKVLADYAEWLAAKALGLKLVEGGAQKGYDAEDPRTGLKYQVKARQVAPPYMQPDLRGQGDLADKPFDLLVGILVDGNFEVIRAAVVPLSIVQERAKPIAYNNGYRLHMASGLLNLPEVIDVTAEVRRASESWLRGPGGDAASGTTLDELRDRLVGIGEAQMAKPPGRVVFTRDGPADDLLNDVSGHPHAFVLACLMDRQVKAERAWMVPSIVRQAVGSFEMTALVTLTEDDWLDIMTGPPAAHRLPGKMAIVAHRGIARISDRYGGDASRLWASSPPSVRVVRRFLEFFGAGPKIATMATNILARDFRVPMADYRAIDISADVQVQRVMARLGFVEDGAGVDVVVYAARELNPDFPGIFDLALWDIGRNTCRPTAPRCEVCPLRDLCAYAAAK